MEPGDTLTVAITIQVGRNNILILFFHLILSTRCIIGSDVHRFISRGASTILAVGIGMHYCNKKPRIPFLKHLVKVFILFVFRIDECSVGIQVVIDQGFRQP